MTRLASVEFADIADEPEKLGLLAKIMAYLSERKWHEREARKAMDLYTQRSAKDLKTQAEMEKRSYEEHLHQAKEEARRIKEQQLKQMVEMAKYGTTTTETGTGIGGGTYTDSSGGYFYPDPRQPPTDTWQYEPVYTDPFTPPPPSHDGTEWGYDHRLMRWVRQVVAENKIKATVHKAGHFPTQWMIEAHERATASEKFIRLQLEAEGVVVIGSEGDNCETHTLSWQMMEHAEVNPIILGIETVEKHLDTLFRLKKKVKSA